MSSGFARVVAELRKNLVLDHKYHFDVISTQDAPKITFNKLKISFVAIKLLFIKKDYDVVHIQGNTPFFSDVCLFLFHLFRKRIVYTYQCDATISSTTSNTSSLLLLVERVYNYIHKLLTRYADVVVFTTESFSITRRDKAKRYCVIPLGVDAKFFTTSNERDYSAVPRKVIFVGQLQPYKGVDLLIDAAKDKKLQVFIGGKGKLFDQYKAKTRRYGNIRMLGFVPDAELPVWYSKADFVALPSISAAEAFGLVTLEGMAGGCVPITSDLPGVKDLSSPTGFVFRCGDVADLSRVLSLAQDIDPAELRKRSEASRELSKKFSWKICVDQYARLFEYLVKSKK